VYVNVIVFAILYSASVYFYIASQPMQSTYLPQNQICITLWNMLDKCSRYTSSGDRVRKEVA